MSVCYYGVCCALKQSVYDDSSNGGEHMNYEAVGDSAPRSSEADTVKQVAESLLPLFDKHVTVFLTAGSGNAEALLNAVNSMLLTPVSIILSENFMSMAGTDVPMRCGRLITEYAKMKESVKKSVLAVIPILTRNTLAKISVGVQDNLLTRGIAAALMSGVPVIAVRDYCNPESNYFKKAGYDKNPGYSRMLLEHEQRLVSFGVKMVDEQEFAEAVRASLYPGFFN